MTQDQTLATIQGVREVLLSTTSGQQPKRPQVGLGFMKIKFTSDNNRKAKRNTPLTQTTKSRLPSVFSEVMTSLKSHKDRQLDKELHDINIRKRNREVEHFLSQRQFFIGHVFTNNNELRFSRFKNQSGTASRAQSCPQFTSNSTRSEPSLSPTVTSLTPGPSANPPSVTASVNPPSVTASVNPPSITASVTPALPNHSPDSSRPKSQANSRSSQSRSSKAKDKPALMLRDLLFLEESEEPPTPNRRRILQARARMFPRNHSSNKKRPITAPGSGMLDRAQEVEFPAICTGAKERHVRFQNKTQVRRAKSEGVVRTDVETEDQDGILPYTACTCNDGAHTDQHTACSHGSADTCSHVENTGCHHDNSQLEDLEAAVNIVSTSQHQHGLLLTTPTPRSDGPLKVTPRSDGPLKVTPCSDSRAKVSWSETIVEPRAAARVLEGRSAKQRFQAKRQATFKPSEPAVDLEAHERMLQRIMVTIPPDVIAKATANATNMSDLMGYTEQRENLLQQERRHGQRLDMADTRFVRLMELLRK